MRRFVSRTAEYVVWPDVRSGVHKTGIQNARETARSLSLIHILHIINNILGLSANRISLMQKIVCFGLDL